MLPGAARRLPGDVVTGAAAACPVSGTRPALWGIRGFGHGLGLQTVLGKDNHGDGHPWDHWPMAAPPSPKAELYRPPAS